MGRTYTAAWTLHVPGATNVVDILVEGELVPDEVSVTAEGVLSWTAVASTDGQEFILRVTETGGETIYYTPQVIVCNCQNEGNRHYQYCVARIWLNVFQQLTSLVFNLKVVTPLL